MPLGPAIADDHGAAVPRIARAIVVAMEEERARFEIAWRPQPEELAEIALGRRLRFACADGPDAQLRSRVPVQPAPTSTRCPFTDSHSDQWPFCVMRV